MISSANGLDIIELGDPVNAYQRRGENFCAINKMTVVTYFPSILDVISTANVTMKIFTSSCSDN